MHLLTSIFNIPKFTYSFVIEYITWHKFYYLFCSLKSQYWRNAKEIVYWNTLLLAKNCFAFFLLKKQNVRKMLPTLLLWFFTKLHVIYNKYAASFQNCRAFRKNLEYRNILISTTLLVSVETKKNWEMPVTRRSSYISNLLLLHH